MKLDFNLQQQIKQWLPCNLFQKQKRKNTIATEHIRKMKEQTLPLGLESGDSFCDMRLIGIESNACGRRHKSH